MSVTFSRMFVLLTAAAGAANLSFSDDLDASLEAQKKKAQRHVYSEQAVLADHNLTVPRTASEEEAEADRKLREIEAEFERKTAEPPVPINRPATAVTVPRPAENKNWLTAAILDAEQAQKKPGESDETWLEQELERQKKLKELKSDEKENELVEKLLRDKKAQQITSPAQERLKQYQLAQPRLFGSLDKDSDAGSDAAAAASYIVPMTATPDPMAGIRPARKKENPETQALLAPQAARLSAGLKKAETAPSAGITPFNPMTSLQQQKKPQSVFSYGRNNSKPVPLTPMEMIRKSSPINQADPFQEDHMPKIKTSIWE